MRRDHYNVGGESSQSYRWEVGGQRSNERKKLLPADEETVFIQGSLLLIE